jgi:crossover junction endodeoxyribonuclease RusA
MIQFTVYGTPRPQGSMRSFRHRLTSQVVTTSDNKHLKPWRQEVAQMAVLQRAQLIETGPVALGLRFYFKRPKSAPKSRIYPTVKPDLDKTIRAILDALKGIIYGDDSQVVRFDHVEKLYDNVERAEIQVRPL